MKQLATPRNPKVLLTLLLVVLALAGRSQGLPVGQAVNIPGTHLFIVPPPGFRVATTLVGLRRDDGAVIQVTDLVGGSFYTNAATFSREKFEARGVTVYDYQEQPLGGYPAKFIHLQMQGALRGRMVVFGDSTFSAMVTGLYDGSDLATGGLIKDALATITYDKKLPVNPLATAPFSLDDTQSAYKLSKASGNMFVYTIGGQDIKGTENAESLLVAPVPADPGVPLAELARQLQQSAEKYGLAEMKVRRTSADKINGYDAYETELTGTRKGRKTTVYLLVVVHGPQGIIMQGNTPEVGVNAVNGFRRLAQTLRFKR